MRPHRTQVFVCTSPADYKRCHTFLTSQEADQPLQYPTVFAEREGEVVGLLTSSTKKQALCAGPLVIGTKKPAFVAIRLLEAYEKVLALAGVQRYLFCIDKTNAKWNTVVQQCGLTPYHETDTAWWYSKKVLNYG